VRQAKLAWHHWLGAEGLELPVRVGLVVTDVYEGGSHADHDTPILLEALAAVGLEAAAVVWHSPSVDWSTFDLLVIRSPWDYSSRHHEFLEWLTMVSTLVPVQNDPKIISWNLDKRYLEDLRAVGVPTVPTHYCGASERLVDALRAYGSQWVVVKPTVSAGSRDTGLFRADDPNALALGAQILRTGREVMVQPEVESLSAGREIAVFLFGGEYSHAISKGALLERGGGFKGGKYTEIPRLVQPSEAQLRLAEQVMSSLPAAVGAVDDSAPVVARLDIVVDDRLGPVLLEAELFEPALFVSEDAFAADRFAQVVLTRVSELDRR